MEEEMIGVVGVAIAAMFFVAGAAQANPELAKKSGCLDCHSVEKRIVGPAYKDVAAKYKNDAGAEARLVEKVKKGGSGNWGKVPMAPHPQMSEADIRVLVKWVLSLGTTTAAPTADKTKPKAK